MTETEKAIIDFCGHHADWWPSTTQVQEMLALAQPEQERLIRIMGTFDLATGHADTFDELLDSLESELRDVLGHYRAAVEEHLTQEPVAWGVFESNLHDMFFTQSEAQEMAKLKGTHAEVRPLYTTPPQRTWVSLTDEEKNEITWGKTIYEILELFEAKLKEKNQ